MTWEKISRRLQGMPLKVVKRGESLYLRGTLPDRATGRMRQQWVALGLKDSAMARERALALALELSAWLIQGTFDWAKADKAIFPLAPKRGADGPDSVAFWAEQFRRHKEATGSCNPHTWQRHYAEFFIDGPLTPETARKAILRYPPNTRTRLRAVQAWNALARFAGCRWTMNEYRGSYGAHATGKLEIPTDAELLAIARRLQGSPWYGWFCLQLCYGLRTHEPHFARLEWDAELGIWLCRVTEGKTGPRIVYPLPAHWPHELGLHPDMPMPQVSGARYEILSARASKAYKRWGIPWPPRTLRYAYVVRGIVTLGFSVPEVAAWCGHSPSVLLQIYSRYLNQATARQNYRRKALGPVPNQ